MSNHRLIIVNDPYSLPTFQAKHIQGWPDLTLSSFELFSKIDKWEVSKDLDYGDHRLITATLALEIPALPKRRYRTKGIGFKKFNIEYEKKVLEEQISFADIDSPEDFEAQYARFILTLRGVCDRILKKRKSSYQPSLNWWSNELRKKQKLRTCTAKKNSTTGSNAGRLLKIQKGKSKVQEKYTTSQKRHMEEVL